MQTPPQDTVSTSPINLPKGGGAIRGMEAALGDVGPDGAASLSLPLPVSPGRGYAPELALQYHSAAGNGVFGIGWQLARPSIDRRTDQGVPAYDDSDEFLGPQGGVLVPERNPQGDIVRQTRSRFGNTVLDQTHTVTRYFPRVEGSFDRIEQWQPARGNCFWLVQGADGQLHAFGKTAQARVAQGEQVAQWLLEESVSPTGEHVAYAYRAEDGTGVDLSGQEQQRRRGALRHLVEVCYGNRTPAAALYLWQGDPLQQAWLFRLVLDYGERGLDTSTPPHWRTTGAWLARQDPWSDYRYGFEIRCHRLCRQILMYHQSDPPGAPPFLVSRLLLDHDENPVLSQLVGARQWAYEDGRVLSLPPVEWRYTPSAPDPDARWQPWQGLPGLDEGQPWQLVDLYGEGLPGLLYRAGNGWHYRAPVRDTAAGAGPDAVTYGAWETVPVLPATAGQSQLMDCSGDGRLDWIITRPGMAGFFSLNPDRSVSGFIPFSAWPNEVLHPRAQLADLTGGGRPDVVLIGPRSVRLYANRGQGFEAARECPQADGVTLPVPGQDAGALVAFADLLGSGQQHLVEVRHNSVRCWPSLGRGRFGLPLLLATLEEDATTFHPGRVFLADLDGSGAADLILAQGDKLRVYRNQAGNGFAAPLDLPLPAGCRFDGSSRLTAADIDGRGMTSLILSTPLPTMRHWRHDFCSVKPYLLAGVNNHMGADSELVYRSSAQFWLDDKAGDQAAGRSRVCRLPFPVHTLARVVNRDEITGNTLSQVYRYHDGVYDGREREFRGFARVESEDTAQGASAAGAGTAFTPPLLTRTWYHTGGISDAHRLPGTPWQGDPQAFAPGDTRLTAWDGQTQQDIPLPPETDSATREWMARALKGQVLRQEVYGLDDSPQAVHPYHVSQFRHQVRLVQAGHGQAGDGQTGQGQTGQGQTAPVVLPQPLEQLDCLYERIPADPQCSHQVRMASTAYGQPVHSVTVNYPRRPRSTTTVSPYPDDLPATSVASSYDAQQQVLRLTELRQGYHHLTQTAAWQPGIPDTTRQNVLQFGADQVPSGGLGFEELDRPDGLLAPGRPRVYAGQTQVIYREQPPASLPVLVDHTETAELDEAALTAYQGVLPQAELAALLTGAGYRSVPKLLPVVREPPENVWVAARGYTRYLDTLFYLPASRQSSHLTGAVTLTYDAQGFVTGSTDALGSQVTVLKRDSRFLVPVHIRDINGNESRVALDALGRVVAGWFQGTENGQAQAAGFTLPDAADTAPVSVDTLLARMDSSTPLTVASRQAWSPFSWMAQVDAQAWNALPDAGALASRLLALRLLIREDVEGSPLRLTARGCRWLKTNDPLPGLPDTVRQALCRVLNGAVALPAHAITLQVDRYPDAGYYPDGLPQQIQAALRYSDGFGRHLQALVRVGPGPAWQRQAGGELVVDRDGRPVEAQADRRWAVSGRVEHDNKGLVVRTFQPYFINSWQYVADRSLRACGPADLHYHDPLGRTGRVETAKRYQRRIRHYPWFSVAEDENDLPPLDPLPETGC